MGGRGQYSHSTARMTHFKQANIPRQKIKDYLLSPKNPEGKAEFFKSLGYTTRNADKLVNDMRKGLKNNKADVMKPNKHGRIAIEVTMMLGITRKVEVVTGWCIDPGKKVPRLVTAYPKKK